MLFIGRVSHPIVLRIASQMATKTEHLLLHPLKDLEALIKYAKQAEPMVTFHKTNNQERFHLDVVTDAAMANKKESAPRGGYVILRRKGDLVHPIHWSSRKLRRVARSSSTAEVLAAADAHDFGIYLQAILSEIMYLHPIRITSDSAAVFGLSSSTKKPEEVRNLIDLAGIREDFESGKVAMISWFPGCYLISDPLTKDNRETADLLHTVLRTGHYPEHPDSVYRISPNGGVENDIFGSLDEPEPTLTKSLT